MSSTYDKLINAAKSAGKQGTSGKQARGQSEQTRPQSTYEALLGAAQTARQEDDRLRNNASLRGGMDELYALAQEKAARELQNQNLWDRISGNAVGAAKDFIGSKASFYGNALEGLVNIGERLGSNTSDYAGWATDELTAGQIGLENDPEKRQQQRQTARDVQEWGYRQIESGARDMEKAQTGAGWLGRIGLGIESSMIGMAGDKLESVAIPIPGGSLLSLATRAAGSGMYEADKAGASYGRKMAYGLGAGGLEAGSEMLFGGLSKIYGRGIVDNVGERVIRRLVSSDAGRKVLLALGDMGEEAVEEAIVDLVDPLIKTVYNGKSVGESYRENFDAGQMLEDALVGGLMGAFGAGTKAIGTKARPSDYSQTVRKMGYADTAEQQLLEKGWNKKDSTNYSELIAKQVAGESLSAKQQSMMDSRPTAGEIAGEIRRGEQKKAVAEEHAQTGKQRERLDGELKDFFRKNLTEGEVPDAVAEQMQKEYDMNPETGSAAFAYAAREAFQYGNLGLSLSEAKAKAQLSGSLTGTSFEHIWKLGAMQRVGGEGKGAGEAKNEVRAHLAKYGEDGANRLAAVHDGLTTAEEYAEIVDKAVFYAKNGADLQTVVEETRNESSTAKWAQDRELGKLTDEQVAVIQELGPQLAAQDRETVRKTAEAFAGIREAAAEANTLTQVNKQLTAARNGLESARTEMQAAEKEMRQMQDSGAWSTEEEAYNAVVRRVEELDGIIENGEKLVRDLEAKRAEAQKAAPQKRKKGTVSFAEDVDQKNLNRQQKKNIAAVQALADAVNIDYVLYAGKQNEGGYYVDGQIYMNINAAVDVTVNGQETKMSIFGFTLSHELTHHLKKYAPEEYQALRDFVVEKIRAEKGEKGLSQLVQEQISMERNEKKLSYDQAVDEVVANSCITMLRDSKVAKDLARKSMTTAEKIVDFLEEFVGKLRDAFEGEDFHGDHRLFNAAKALENDAEEALNLWEEALKAADVNYNAAQTVGKLSPATGSEAQAMAWEVDTEYDFGVSQFDINDYVEHAYEKTNEEPYIKYAEVDDRLANDVSDVFPDIKEYAHALRDNDIRHVRYSHGEKTKEKYPVTENDQKLIPYIVQNYDDVIPKTNANGDPGLVYVKAMSDNVVYYVEAVSSEMYGEKLLINKQMIKTGYDGIPHLYGLKDGITKKQTVPEFLAGLISARKAYVQDVTRKQSVSKNIVPNKTATVKENSEQFMAWDGVEERAVEHFGTTDDFRIAGYILRDGRMLDFSGAHWMEGYDEAYIDEWRKKNDIRQVDHEDVNEAFGDDAPSDSALAFIRRGNIRIAPEAPGLELYAKREPTAQQYAQIRDFVNYINDRQDYFTNGSRLWIDLTTDRKQRERMSYTGEIRADRVVNDLKHFYKTGEVREQGASAWFMTWDDQVSFDDLTEGEYSLQAAKNLVGPKREQAIADVLAPQVKNLLEGFTPDDWDGAITAEEIEDWMEPDIYHAWNQDLFSGSMEAMDALYNLAKQDGEKADAAFQLMEQIAETMSPLNQQVYTLDDSERAPAFAAYYGQRHPSLYYPGYKPGDLFWNENQWEFEEDIHRNLLNEIEYLTGLIDDRSISDETRAEARELLERLTGRPKEWTRQYNGELREYQEVFYMSWDNDHNDWAPEFYSKLNRTVAEWTNDKGRPMPEKMGAGAVIPWLRGRGVKAEEIRWSGLQPWLEGRKSVTKDELAAYLAGNMIDIRTEVRGMNDATDNTKWSDYTMKGGARYREILFVDPNSKYDNLSMRVHWERPGVLAHARVQDMEEVSEGKRVLFIEELQSDWHNAGAKKDPILGKAAGFASDYDNSAADSVAKLIQERIAVQTEGPKFEDIDTFARSLLDRVHKADAERDYQYSLSRVSILDWITHDNVGILDDNLLWLSDKEGLQESAEKLALSLMTEKEKDLVKRSRDTYRRVRELTVQEQEARAVMEERPPEAPFAGSSDTYHEYVMKHLLRLAAEGDYDAIGWTTAEQQAERWKDPDTERWEKSKESYRISYDQTIPKFMNKYTKQWGGKVGDMALAVPYTNGQETRVWSVEITPEMKKAVLHEGQPLFMSWDGTEDTEQEWQDRLEAYSRLEAEQAIQEQVFQSIRELTRSQKKSLAEIQKRLKIGKTPEARMDDVQRMARSLISKYNSTMKEEDVVGEIARIWNYVLQDQDPSGNVVRNMAEELAEKIADSAEVAVIDETEEETLKEIRNRIHGQKLVISADETGDIPGYANLAEFRKKNFGRFSVAGRNSDAVTDQHVPVDSLYEELRNSYGDYYFPESTNQGEMLGVLSGYFEAAERQKANPFADSYGEAVEAIAGEISRSAWWDAVRLTPLTEAEQAKVQNAEGREIIQNLRDERKITKSQAEKLEKPMAAGEQLAEQAEALKAQIRELVEAGEMSKAEAAELQASLLKMTRRVDTLEEQYRMLEEAADKRVAQIREEGAAKVAEAIAKQQEKNAKNVQALKDHFKEVQKNARDRREESGNVKKYRKQITQQVEALRKWMMSPSNKNILQHIPAEIQKTVADFLESISLVSKTYLRTGGQQTTRADDRYLRSMKRMRDAIKANVNLQGQYSGYNDLPPDFVENFEKMIEQTEAFIKSNPGGFIVNRMTGAELRDLRDTLKILRKYITQMNEFHNNAMFQHAYEAGDDTILYLSQFAKSKSSGIPYRFMRFDYMRPSYAFEHFGKGGQSIEHEFREGQAVQAFLANEIIDFAKRTYTSKEVKEWSRENKTFELSDGQTVTVPVTHLMSLYCLNKREQARLHIYGDGIRIANFQNGKNVELDEGHLVSIPDVQKMIGALTERQKEVADALQKFMSTEAAKWGNYVSMARFDVEQFTEENYFPINSDGRYLSTTADESPDNAGLYALLNSGFTKELKENARNRIILYNVFDVFANHTASMAQYRAFALPMLDALKWFNYKDPNTSVRAKLSSAFGAPLDERAGSGAKGYAEQFVINLLKAYNGTSAQGDPYDTTALKILHRYNGAAIAYNLRVIVQQPTAIARAAMILSPAKLTKGLGMSIVQLRKLADEMEAHSGIAAWKALGFYDTNISRGLTDLIKQNPSILDRVMDFGTKGAEMADRFTWAAMWYAAKDSVKRSDYASEEEYFKAVTDLFEEVIYKTQVVDSLLTKAEFLRSKGAIARQLGSFMSEPSATMSMLSDAYFKYTDDLQRGMSRSEAWKKNGANIARTAAVYAVGQVILSAAQAVIDAWRDDDEYDPDNWVHNYLLKYLNAFKSNLVEEEMIFGKIPVVSELYDLLKGYLDKFGVFEELGLDIYGNDVSSGLAMYTKYLTKAIDIFAEKIVKGKSNYTNYAIVYNLLRFASNVSGIPFGTAWREIQDLWNNTVGFMAPSKKLVTYERALDKSYEEYIRNSGMAKKDYEKVLDEADSGGGTAPTQDELGTYLLVALADGTVTEEQAQALWTSRWNKPTSTTFDKWREKNGALAQVAEQMGESVTEPETPATTPKPSASPKPAAPAKTESSKPAKNNIPVYSTKRDATMAAKPAGMSEERYAEILRAADTDGNSSLKQDELGAALKRAVERREMSHEEAAAVWASQGWSANHSYEWWLSRH